MGNTNSLFSDNITITAEELNNYQTMISDHFNKYQVSLNEQFAKHQNVTAQVIKNLEKKLEDVTLENEVNKDKVNQLSVQMSTLEESVQETMTSNKTELQNKIGQLNTVISKLDTNVNDFIEIRRRIRELETKVNILQPETLPNDDSIKDDYETVEESTSDDHNDSDSSNNNITSIIYHGITYPINAIGDIFDSDSDTSSKKKSIETKTIPTINKQIQNDKDETESLESNSSDKKNFLGGFRNLMKKKNKNKNKKSVKWNDSNRYYDAKSSNPM